MFIPFAILTCFQCFCVSRVTPKRLFGLLLTGFVFILGFRTGHYVHQTHTRPAGKSKQLQLQDKPSVSTMNLSQSNQSSLLDNSHRQLPVNKHSLTLDELLTKYSLPELPASLDVLHFGDKPVTNIYYIKVHKCGSTTLQNIIYRFGVHNNLTFAVFQCQDYMPFPNPAYSMYFVHDPSRKMFNIMPEHAMFKEDAYQSYMPNDTRVIAVIRHPMLYLESSFGFHGLARVFPLLSKEKNKIEAFLNNPAPIDKKAFVGSSKGCGPVRKPSYTRNAIAYHFGFSQQWIEERMYVENFLKYIDKKVDLVLILEMFDESLILLKRFFNWTTRDIIYMPLWSLGFHKKENFHSLSKIEEKVNLIAKHRAWAPVDYLLYEHFSRKLDKLVELQPADYKDEVKYFKTIVIVKVKEFCQSMCNGLTPGLFSATSELGMKYLTSKTLVLPKNQWHEEIKLDYRACVEMVLATHDYPMALRVKQVPGLCVNKGRGIKINKHFCNQQERVMDIFPWSIIQNKLFISIEKCMKHVNG